MHKPPWAVASSGAGQTSREVLLDMARQTESVKRHFAGRAAIGSNAAVGPVIGKNGIHMERLVNGQLDHTLALGGACSEVFSRHNLARILMPALKFQMEAVEVLARGDPDGVPPPPMSIHTSMGLPPALGRFKEALERHLPWEPQDRQNWWFNLQLEGTTAVWAAVEALMHLRIAEGADSRAAATSRGWVGVATSSYHGPKSTALGQPALPRWPGAPRTEGQVAYPVPQDGESRDAFMTRFDMFLKDNEQRVGVMIFEPQWGSSFAARPWQKDWLRDLIVKCKARGILVLCDEIMCGLGRHGEGTLFLSKAWSLDPDAVTFGKSVAAGCFPLAGVALKRGMDVLGEKDVKLVQSHTYAGSSSLALLTATEVLQEVPKWFEHARNMGKIVEEVMSPLSDGKFLKVDGLGLMWGGLFKDPDAATRQRALGLLREACLKEGVWPYLVPVGGFMMSPPMDVEEAELRLGLQRLKKCLTSVREAMLAEKLTAPREDPATVGGAATIVSKL